MMYRIGRRLRSMNASLCGVDVGILLFNIWNSNKDPWNGGLDSVRWAV